MITKCQFCQKEFKIITQEEAFYSKAGLPLPTACPDCRRERRLKFKNPRQLNKRACAKCGAEVITTYPADFLPPVYCSKCFEENFN
ncbi:MAG: hypothetical protein WCT37_01475 [Patescibacteria group bacterium]|jgi:hypothetical protein